MINNKENISSGVKKHKSKKVRSWKAVLSAKQKKTCMAAGGVLLLLSIGSLAFCLVPKTENVENTLYSYVVSADSSYRVHVIPNELYGSEWLEESKAYPEALTDYIELYLKASLQGSGPAAVAGSYQVKAVLEGYQISGESRQIIYDKQFPLRDGKITQTDDGQAELEDTIQIPLAPYREQAQRAEQILCTSVAKDLYLSFDGNFTINTASEKKKQDFTYQISLPIGTGSSIYQITKPEPFSKDGKITETQEGKKPINFRNILLSTSAGAVGLALLLFACFFTRLPDAEEAWRREMNRILRKYGSRMTRLEQLPDPKHKECIYVADIESMIAMAEELRQPLFYQPGADQLPRDGTFCISGTERLYLVKIRSPHTTKVVCEEAKGGN